MAYSPDPTSWRQKVWQAAVLLLVVALASRVAAELLSPLVPAMVIIVLLGAILWFIIGRRRR